MATTDTEREEALTQAFTNFKKGRQRLKGLLEETQALFSSLCENIKHTEETTSIKLTNLLLGEDDVREVKRTFKDPCIIFVGQTKAGKSSLINEVLGASVVKADATPCTARIVELEYGENETPIVEIRSKSGEILKTMIMKKNFITSGVANLRYEDRHKPELLETSVNAKINIPFLKSGVKIIDSPGKNENPYLDDLVMKHMDSILPLIVYVIDGQMLLTTQDIDDIKLLYHSVPEGNVFFVVTKVDSENDTCQSSDEDDSDEEEKVVGQSSMEKTIKEGVYSKLVANHFLGAQPMNECKNFHALSSWNVKTYRRTLKNSLTPKSRQILKSTKRYMEDFLNFKSCLLDFTREQLIRTEINAAKILQLALKKCLDYFIDRANELFEEKLHNDRNIQLIEVEELLLSEVLKKSVLLSKNEFSTVVKDVVEEQEANIMQMSAEFKFVEYKVPTDGYIARSAVEQCRMELRNGILNRVEDLIQSEVLRRCSKLDDLYIDLKANVKHMQEAIESQIPIHDTVQDMLIGEYTFNINDTKLTRTVWQNIKKMLRKLTWARLNEAIKGKVHVGGSSWKKDVARDILELIHADQVADIIVQGIVDHIAEGHNKFVVKLADLKELYKRSHKMGDDDRVKIRSMAPAVGKLQLDAWNIMDRLKFGRITFGKVRGKGAQGIVQDCNALGPKGETCVGKIIRLDGESELQETALEIHYSRKLNGPQIMPIYGSFYDEIGKKIFELTIIMPRLERDLLEALPTISTLKDRLGVAIDIAKAIKYIHDKGMMHRDIKAANVMLDRNNCVLLTDFGLCKPQGVSDKSFVGTPVHMAPEIIKGERYTTAVDVYSFGILLWYICEGNGNHPQYLLACRAVNSLLLITALGQRPERLSTFREDCWNLMNKCWLNIAVLRPRMDAVIEELEAIVGTLS